MDEFKNAILEAVISDWELLNLKVFNILAESIVDRPEAIIIQAT